MNWQHIKETFPEAYGNARNLFDFFDEKGIYIGVSPVSKGVWCWMIHDATFNKCYCSQRSDLGSRPIAEVEAFNKGFELIQLGLQA